MSTAVRNMAAVLGGVITAGLVVLAGERLNTWRYPLPEGIEPTDREAMVAHVETLPTGAFTGVLLAWAAGAIAGAFVAARLSPDKKAFCGWIVGGVMLAGALANLFLLPHPVWMMVSTPLVFVGGAWLGIRLGGGRTTG